MSQPSRATIQRLLGNVCETHTYKNNITRYVTKDWEVIEERTRTNRLSARYTIFDRRTPNKTVVYTDLDTALQHAQSTPSG